MFKVKNEDTYIVKWCCPSVSIVNFEHPSHLFLVFSIGDLEQVINCYDIILTSLHSDFVTSSSCLSIYTLILNFMVNWFTFKSSKIVLQWVLWNNVFFSCLHFNLILFTSTVFCMILMQFDVPKAGWKSYLGYMVRTCRIISELKFQPCP